MATKTRRIIDADGHVAEDSAAIIPRMPEAYREKAQEQPKKRERFHHEVGSLMERGHSCPRILAG